MSVDFSSKLLLALSKLSTKTLRVARALSLSTSSLSLFLFFSLFRPTHHALQELNLLLIVLFSNHYVNVQVLSRTLIYRLGQ